MRIARLRLRDLLRALRACQVDLRVLQPHLGLQHVIVGRHPLVPELLCIREMRIRLRHALVDGLHLGLRLCQVPERLRDGVAEVQPALAQVPSAGIPQGLRLPYGACNPLPGEQRLLQRQLGRSCCCPGTAGR